MENPIDSSLLAVIRIATKTACSHDTRWGNELSNDLIMVLVETGLRTMHSKNVGRIKPTDIAISGRFVVALPTVNGFATQFILGIG